MIATVESKQEPDIQQLTAQFSEICALIEGLKRERRNLIDMLGNIDQQVARAAENYLAVKRNIDDIVAAGLEREAA